MDSQRSTANERFRKRTGRVAWIAGAAAIGVHVGIVWLVPPFDVFPDDLKRSPQRMVIQLEEWRAPAGRVVGSEEYAVYDTAMPEPSLRNVGAVNHRLPRIYPRVLWRYREPSSALVRVEVDRSGKVRFVRLLDGEDPAADTALLRLVRLMRFEPLERFEERSGFIADIEVAVVRP